MATARYILLLARAFVVSALLAAAAAAAAEYVRPPPGRIILTEHTEPASHPQQVDSFHVHDRRHAFAQLMEMAGRFMYRPWGRRT